MPVFQMQILVDELSSIGVNCKVGNILFDISSVRRPYFERWLLHRDGFVKMYNENIDYIGIEDVVRIGPFYNVYCLIENQHITENDANSYKLLDADPYFNLHNGEVTKLGWSGGVLADILANDSILYNSFATNIMKEEIRKISVKVANFACIIETRTWEVNGLASIYKVIDRIGFKVKELLKQVQLGNDIDLK
ncbi:MAG: hypothetical protein WA421_15580 [Nitrososphaeraceae archaeon]